jgi:hypothetical protein
MKIKFEGNRGYMHFNCLICGERDRKGDVIAIVYQNEEKVGHICDRCREAGSSTFKDKLMVQVKNLREYSTEMVAWMEWAASEEWDIPSQEEFKKVEWEAMAVLMVDCTKEQREDILNHYPDEEQKIITEIWRLECLKELREKEIREREWKEEQNRILERGRAMVKTLLQNGYGINEIQGFTDRSYSLEVKDDQVEIRESEGVPF